MSSRYTPLQGQYLAFIYYYTKIHGCAPAEVDMQSLTAVDPSNGFDFGRESADHTYTRRTARSIRLAVAREDLPDLE